MVFQGGIVWGRIIPTGKTPKFALFWLEKARGLFRAGKISRKEGGGVTTSAALENVPTTETVRAHGRDGPFR